MLSEEKYPGAVNALKTYGRCQLTVKNRIDSIIDFLKPVISGNSTASPVFLFILMLENVRCFLEEMDGVGIKKAQSGISIPYPRFWKNTELGNNISRFC